VVVVSAEDKVRPRISVVVASHNAGPNIADCLKAINASSFQRDTEIIVVDNSNDGTDAIVQQQFPSVKLVRCYHGKLIPELWEVGIHCSRGDIVALTSAHCVPAKNWIDEISLAHHNPYAGIGGAIENDPRGGWVSWAIYFCRYSSYMLPFSARVVHDFAADNASYKRSALDACRSAMREGFWETFIHAEMTKAGAKLFLMPAIVVYHRQSFSFAGFMRQRFRHGRRFGSERVRHLSFSHRMALIVISPLIPALLFFRITRRVMTRKRHFARYFLVTPILALFLLSWSAGELTGYVWIHTETRQEAV
jgi:glycosyltransferase involved in cell wall biosynthesis